MSKKSVFNQLLYTVYKIYRSQGNKLKLNANKTQTILLYNYHKTQISSGLLNHPLDRNYGEASLFILPVKLL